MNESWRFACILCVVQVSALAALGIASCWIFVRRNPRGAVIAATGTGLLIVAVSVIVVLPKRLDIGSPDERLAGTNNRFAAGGEDDLVGSMAHEEQAGGHGGGAFLILALSSDGLEKSTDHLSRFIAGNEPTSGTRWLLYGYVALCWVVGTFKFWIGVASAISVSNSSTPVSDRRILQLFAELQTQIAPRANAGLFQSDQIDSALVIGIFRPRIVLPSQWLGYCEDQLQSVLAHELAHIQQRDFATRLLGFVVQTIHFYNPLVHLLQRKMVFAQELRADQIAAAQLGLNRYVRCLVGVALQSDCSEGGQPHAGITPVFSGYLIRRIKMLSNHQAADTSIGVAFKSKPSRSDKLYSVACALGTLFMFTVGGVIASAGVFAEPPQQSLGQQPPEARIAKLPAGASASRPADTVILETMFQRDALDPGQAPANDEGMIAIRFAEVLQWDAIAAATGLLNQWIGGGLQDAASNAQPVAIDLANIQTAYGLAMLKLNHDPEADPHKNRLTFGVGDMAFDLKRPVNLSRWMKSNLPSHQSIDLEGHPFFELPVLPSLGPVPLVAALRGTTTLCLTHGRIGESATEKYKGIARLVKHQSQENTSGWVEVFRAVDGGLVTFATTDHGVSIPEEFEFDSDNAKKREAAERIHKMLTAIGAFAVGIDLSDDGDWAGVHLAFQTESPESAREVLNQMRALRQMAVTELEHPHDDALEDTDIIETQYVELNLRFLKQLQFELDPGSSMLHARSLVDIAAPAEMLRVFLQQQLASARAE